MYYARIGSIESAFLGAGLARRNTYVDEIVRYKKIDHLTEFLFFLMEFIIIAVKKCISNALFEC